MNIRYIFTKSSFLLMMLFGLCFSFGIACHTNKNRLFNILFNSYHIALTTHKATWKHDTKKVHPNFLQLKKRPVNVYGIDQHGRAVSRDTGEIVPGAEVFSKYVSEYLAQLLDAVGNFRNIHLKTSITLNWIERVSRLQGYVDALGLKFALEIGISRQIGFFELDLVDRLKKFRQQIEEIIGHKLTLFIDFEKVPESIPGQSVKQDIESLVKSIDIAVKYWYKLCEQIPEAKHSELFTEKTVARLNQIKTKLIENKKGDISQNQQRYEGIKSEVFSVFAMLESLQSVYTRHSKFNAESDKELVSLDWVYALSPKLRLERLLAPEFKFNLLGHAFSRTGDAAKKEPNLYNNVVLTNIPGIMVGYDTYNFFTISQNFLYSLFAYKNQSVRKATIKQLFIAGELKRINSKPNSQYLKTAATKNMHQSESKVTDSTIQLSAIPVGFVNFPEQLSTNGICFSSVICSDSESFYLEPQIKIEDRQDIEFKIFTMVHELFHAIVVVGFSYLDDTSTSHEFCIKLTPQKRIYWHRGDDERFASGVNFSGENPFLHSGQIPAIGWINQNVVQILSGIEAILYYKGYLNEKATTKSLHIPNIVINEQAKLITFSGVSSFSNLKEVYSYLNKIQYLLQKGRLLVYILEDFMASKLLSIEEKNKALTDLNHLTTSIANDMHKISEAVVLANYKYVLEELKYTKAISKELQSGSIEFIKESIVMFAAQFEEQFFDAGSHKDFQHTILEQMLKQYLELIDNELGSQKAKQWSNGKRVSYFRRYKQLQLSDFACVQKPYGPMIDIQGESDIFTQQIFVSFARELGVPKHMAILFRGVTSDYKRTIDYFIRHKKTTTSSYRKLSNTIMHASETAAVTLFAKGGNANPLAEALLYYFTEVVPNTHPLIVHEENGILLRLGEVISSNDGHIIINADIQNRLQNRVFNFVIDHDDTKVYKYQVTADGNIQYLNDGNEILKNIPIITGLETAYEDYYLPLKMKNGGYFFMSRDVSKKSHFTISKEFADINLGLKKTSEQSSVKVSSSIRYFQAICVQNHHPKLNLYAHILACKLLTTLDILEKNCTDIDAHAIMSMLVTNLAIIAESMQDQCLEERVQFYQTMKIVFSKSCQKEDGFITLVSYLDKDSIFNLLKIMGEDGLKSCITMSEFFINELHDLADISLKEIDCLIGEDSLYLELPDAIVHSLNTKDVSLYSPLKKNCLMT